jgi:hypothetical protein
MSSKQFHLLGQDLSTGIEVEFDAQADIDSIRDAVASSLAIVVPSGKFSRSRTPFTIPRLPNIGLD